MIVTVAATVCHMLGTISQPVCREEIVTKTDMPMQACMMGSQIGVADWKEKSIYRGDNWHVSRIRCIPGEYTPKDAI
jgi:hypothetical protein